MEYSIEEINIEDLNCHELSTSIEMSSTLVGGGKELEEEAWLVGAREQDGESTEGILELEQADSSFPESPSCCFCKHLSRWTLINATEMEIPQIGQGT